MPDNANLYLIPLAPLLGALFNLVFGRWAMRGLGGRGGREIVHFVAIISVAFSCFYAFSLVFGHLFQFSWSGGVRVVVGAPLVQEVYTWFASGGGLRVPFALLLDGLSGVMCLVITFVGLLIHIFSVGYMAKDPDYARYFAYLNLFTAAMLILVLGKSLVLTFVGWEGVGLCSYLLIGFWYSDEDKATAGRKAFIMNRIGDFGVILAMLIIFAVAGSLDYQVIEAQAAAFDAPMIGAVSFATVACALLFLGCTGKSAQIPLYTWLPDAMAGPTPVSALIHAATMVTAGVFLCVRLNFLFALAPVVLAVIAVIGAVTALMAATIGITQNDIKKVLAYSTVSQLGFMFMAVGMGAWVAAVFHLVTHAFFKACLFLGSGAVIEACHHNQDIRTMGGLRRKMPVTAATFFISCLAIAGIPIFAGFFSKDEILLYAYVSQTGFTPALNLFVYVVGVIAAFCTAFYMFRLYFLTFEGEFRGDHHTWTHYVHEVWIMSMPLVVLAFLATFGGFLGFPHAFPGHDYLPHLMEQFLTKGPDPVARSVFLGGREAFMTEHGTVATSYEVMFIGISVLVAVLGIAFAWTLYRRGPSPAANRWAKALGPLYQVSHNKYYVDEIYNAVFVRPLRFLGGVCYQVADQLVVDGAGVGGVSATVGTLGNGVRTWHNGNVRRYLLVLTIGLVGVLATVFANPCIITLGPNAVHSFDAGGLQPQMGSRPIQIRGFGQLCVSSDADEPMARTRAAPSAARDAEPDIDDDTAEVQP